MRRGTHPRKSGFPHRIKAPELTLSSPVLAHASFRSVAVQKINVIFPRLVYWFRRYKNAV